jgi:hypothetical protein
VTALKISSSKGFSRVLKKITKPVITGLIVKKGGMSVEENNFLD